MKPRVTLNGAAHHATNQTENISLKPLRIPSIVECMDDPRFFGDAFDGSSWDRWRAILRAAFCLPMSDSDRALFSEVAERDPPSTRIRELWCVIASVFKMGLSKKPLSLMGRDYASPYRILC